MTRPPIEDTLFDRFFLAPEELRDPDLRLAKSMYLFAFLSSSTLEAGLALVYLFWGWVPSAVFHLTLAAALVTGLILLRTRFHPLAFALAYLTIVSASAGGGRFLDGGFTTLVWVLFLPTGVLVLRGERWGWAALAVTLACVVVMSLGWHLAGFAYGAWAIGAGLFLLTALFLRLIRRTMATHQVEKGHALDRLTQTIDNAEKWADQARFLETLMDVIPFPLFHKGMDGRYISTNASFRVVFDVDKQAVTGQKNEDFLLPENAKTLAKIELDLRARDSMAVEETVLVHADGQPHDFIVYLMPFIDSAQTHLGFIGVLIDITDRKHREEKLVQLNATKDQLFSIISHDLRGPVGKLKQLLDIYMDDPGIFDKATWDTVFHDMRRSTDSLFQLLENLLGWARAQQGQEKVRYESVALEPLVGDVFSVLKLLAADKKITLEMDLKLAGPLLTDRHVLSTILRNLVHNALKFTSPGGKILVTAEETPDDLWIEVKDSGIGMTDDLVHRIFKKKERMTTFGTGKEKGQGIGIGLCRDLAEGLGAHLTVESSLGLGTAIRLHLPTPEL